MARKRTATSRRRVRTSARRQAAGAPGTKARRKAPSSRRTVAPGAARRRPAAPRGENMAIAAAHAELAMDRQRARDDVHERDLSGS